MAQALHAVASGGATEESLTTGQRRAIFFASFLTLISAGIGFAVRGAILVDWSTDFGFTKFELGTITGGGLTGFGITIIICSLFADRIGYKPVLTGAFILHLLSALITLAAPLVFKYSGRPATYWTLFVGMFVFALGNGLCEAAINPLTATLFPKNKTHFLNILHAGWPAGLVLGALFAFCFAGEHATVRHLPWEVPMLFFLVPTLLYGFMVLKNPFPVSEAKAAGVSIGTQIATIFAPLLLFLFVIHGMVGYVELGTDSWITDIMNNVKTVIQNWGLLLFIYVSTVMFILRFFAGPIVHKINPVGLLFLAACFGATGLYLLGTVQGLGMIVLAGTVYALGKTFYWPTMLGVIGERYPKGGALAMGFSGGIGMICAGMLGGPGIGYFQDRFASEDLREKNPAVFALFKVDEAKGFLKFEPIQGLDGSKVSVVKSDGVKTLYRDVEIAKKTNTFETDKKLKPLFQWYQDNKKTLQPVTTINGAPGDVAGITSGSDAELALASDGSGVVEIKTKTPGSIPSVPAPVAMHGTALLASAAGPDTAAPAVPVAPPVKNTIGGNSMVSAGSSQSAFGAVDKVQESDATLTLMGAGDAKAPSDKLIGQSIAFAKDHGYPDTIQLTISPKPTDYNLTSAAGVSVLDANLKGGREALKVTALVPATMAACYLLLVIFFAATGGYKPLHLETSGEEVAGPTEGL